MDNKFITWLIRNGQSQETLEDYANNPEKRKQVLEILFYEPPNIMIIQESIKNIIHNQYQISIQDQDPTSLQSIMKTCISEHPMDKDKTLTEHLRALNKHVIDIAIPLIMENIKVHMENIKRQKNNKPIEMVNTRANKRVNYA